MGETTSENVEDEEPPINISSEIEAVLLRFCDANNHQKKEIKRKLREIVDPSSTNTIEPSEPRRFKGRPRGSYKKFRDDWKSTKRDPSHFEHVLLAEAENLLKNESTRQKPFEKLQARKRTNIHVRMPSQKLYLLQQLREQLPIYMGDNIIDVLDVLGDGHCGYRVIAQAMDMGEDWLQVRKTLYFELENHMSLYDDLFGTNRRKQLLESLDCTVTPAPIEKWMSLPDMGLVIASSFNVCVIELSCKQCLTYPPLHSMPPTMPKIISIGFINENHFILLFLRENSPLPQIYSPWRRFHWDIAATWASLLMSRITFPKPNLEGGPTISLG